MEFLSAHLHWWHWVIFGIVLMIIEAFDGQLLLFGLGVVSIFMGFINYIFPTLSINIQLFIYTVLVVLFFIFWQKRRVKKREERLSNVKNQQDELGVVSKEITPREYGEVLFDLPVLGSKKWIATSEEEIKTGSRVKILKVIGQVIKVQEVKQ